MNISEIHLFELKTWGVTYTWVLPVLERLRYLQTVVEHEFVRGMKLEAANPHQPGQICAATITRIIDNLAWISLDGSPKV